MNIYDKFWENAGPGLLDFGLGLYGKNKSYQEEANRLGKAQGPLYQQATDAASGMLTAAGGFDPQAFAADRFKSQQALMAPVQEKEYNDLYRNLYAKGQLGVSNYNPGIEGVMPNGQAMNPQMAAFFAAKNAQRSKDANASLGEGQKYIDSLLARSGLITRQAGNVQSSGLEAQRTQPSRAAGNMETIRGLTGVLKDSGITKDIMRGIPGAVRGLPGMIAGAPAWLSKTLGGYATPSIAGAGGLPDFGGDDYAMQPFDLGGGMNVDEFGNVAGGMDWPSFDANAGGDYGNFDFWG